MLAASAGSDQTYGSDATPTNQAAYYQQTYQYATQSINSGGPLRGMAFWRWDGINSEGTISQTDNSLTLSALQSVPCRCVSQCGCCCLCLWLGAWLNA